MEALEDAGFVGVFPVAFGGGVEGPEDWYEENRTNAETFLNRTAQLSMGVRLRGINTMRLLDGEPVDPWDCLFIDSTIPDLPEILEEWQQPQRIYTRESKWAVDKKPLRRDKSGKAVQSDSPDRYDGLVLSFAEDSDGRGLRAA